MHVQLSLSLHFYTLYLLLNSCNKNDVFWCYSMLVKQSSSFSRKHRTLSLQICVHRTVRLTTEFLDWCRNVCTLYKHLSVTPAAVTSDLKQRLIDTWASISQNVINEAVGQWRKWLRATVRQKDLTVNICYNWNLFFSEPAHYTTGSFQRQHTTQPTLFRATNSLPRKTCCFVSLPSQPFKSKWSK